MFLNELQEKNKELFLKICLHASLSNKVFADEEKEMIYAYCREMNVPESIPDGSELDNVIEILGLQADGVEKKIIILEKTTEDTDFVTWLKGQMPNFVEGLKIIEEKKEEVNPFMGMNPFGPAPVQEKVVENTTPPVAPTTGSSIFDNVAPSTPIPPVTPNPVPPVTEEVKPQTVSNDICASPVANTPVNEAVPTSNGQVEQQASSNSIFG